MPTTDPVPKTVLVAGATGLLGELAELLLARGHEVRAMTRDPDGPASRRVHALGAELTHA